MCGNRTCRAYCTYSISRSVYNTCIFISFITHMYVHILFMHMYVHTYILYTYIHVYASILCVTLGWLSLVALATFYYSCFSIVALYSVFRVLPRPSLVVVIWLTWVFVHLLYIDIPCLNRDCRFVNLWRVEVWLGQ